MAHTNMDWGDEEDEVIRVKTYERDGRTFIVTARDPHGFCKITIPKGPVPKRLAGDWTTYDDAVMAINGYLNWKAHEQTHKESPKKEEKEIQAQGISTGG